MKTKEILLLVPTFCIVPTLQVTPALATLFTLDSFILVTVLLGVYSFVSAFLTMIIAVSITKKRTRMNLYSHFGFTVAAWIAIYSIVEWIRHWGFVAEFVWFSSAIAGALIVLIHNLKEIPKRNQPSLTPQETVPPAS